MPKVPDGQRYDIEEVRREWVGYTAELAYGPYPVEYDAIRRHCHMIEDENPLFLDPAYANDTRHGSVIAPSVMIDYFTRPGAWPPAGTETNAVTLIPTRGDRLVNLNQSFEFYLPVRVGDRLAAQLVIEDIFEKPIKLDPLAVWITRASRIYNQHSELVAIVRNTLLTHREPADVVAAESKEA